MEHNLESAKTELSFFKKKAKGADGRSTLESIERQAREIIENYHVNGLLDLEAEEGFRVSARKNFPAIEDQKTRFGKQIIFSNRETLSAADPCVRSYLYDCPAPRSLCSQEGKSRRIQARSERMMELLTGVKTALVFYSKSMKPHRVLCRLTPGQDELLTQLKSEIPKVGKPFAPSIP